MPKHPLVDSHPPCLFVRLLASQHSEYVNDTSPEFSECLHRVHRVAKRFEPGCTVVVQVAFYRGWVGDVNLVREALNMQESKDAAFIKD